MEEFYNMLVMGVACYILELISQNLWIRFGKKLFPLQDPRVHHRYNHTQCHELYIGGVAMEDFPFP